MKFLIVEDSSTHNEVRVATYILGETVVGNVSSKEKGRSEVGSGECVVNHNNDVRIDSLDCLCDCFDIDDLESRVSWSLNPHHFGLLLDSFCDVLNRSDVDELRLQSMLIKRKSPHVPLSASINIITHDDMVSSLKSMEDGGSSSASAGECNGIFSILDGC